MVDSSPERSRFTGRGPKDASATGIEEQAQARTPTTSGARRVSSSTRARAADHYVAMGLVDRPARPRRRSLGAGAEATRRRRAAPRAPRPPEREPSGRRSLGAPARDARAGGRRRAGASRTNTTSTAGAPPREKRRERAASSRFRPRRAAAAGRVRSGLTSSSEEEEEPSGRRRRAARGREHSSSSGREHSGRRHSSSEGEERTAIASAARRDAHASARAADDRGTASSEARRSAPKAPADDPDAVLDRLDEVLASDVRDGKWTDRLLGVLELHSVFSEHDSQVRQATEKLKRNDRAVAGRGAPRGQAQGEAQAHEG